MSDISHRTADQAPVSEPLRERFLVTTFDGHEESFAVVCGVRRDIIERERKYLSRSGQWVRVETLAPLLTLRLAVEVQHD